MILQCYPLFQFDNLEIVSQLYILGTNRYAEISSQIYETCEFQIFGNPGLSDRARKYPFHQALKFATCNRVQYQNIIKNCSKKMVENLVNKNWSQIWSKIGRKNWPKIWSKKLVQSFSCKNQVRRRFLKWSKLMYKIGPTK